MGFKCPHCGEEIGRAEIARQLGKTGWRKGGLAKGKSKLRGGPEYYRAISAKGLAKRWPNRKNPRPGIVSRPAG